MKLSVSRILAAGLLAAALPLLSACYTTVGTDGRTYFQPMGFSSLYGTGYTYDPYSGYGYRSVSPYYGYRAQQGYTYFTPHNPGQPYTTIPATSTYTSFPLVSRTLVSVGDACIVKPKRKKACK